MQFDVGDKALNETDQIPLELKVQDIWDNLEQTIGEMQAGQSDWFDGADVARVAIEMLLAFPAPDIAACIEASELPSRATKRWLVYEAGRMKGMNIRTVQALARAWEEDIRC